VYAAALLAAVVLFATGESTPAGVVVFGRLPFAFVLFALVLLGVALFHAFSLWVALTGAAVITLYTWACCPAFAWPPDAVPGLAGHVLHEAEHTLLNLGGLLLGFSLLADYFERSGVPDNLPRVLPRKPFWGAFVLLTMVWFMSSFLDNIAAALIGGVMAQRAFGGRVTVGYLAAIIAASNAGGAWSVLGDTTTTMMWIEGVSPVEVAHASIASAVALLCFGGISSSWQVRHQAIVLDANAPRVRVDYLRLLNVVLILVGAVVTNITLDKPFVGVWVAILLGSLWRAPTWRLLGPAAAGAMFLLSLVWCASLMPVQSLPDPSTTTTFGLGFVSAVFDNIPLTKLALEQDHYDWGMLAYAVGFGGSMMWFGSSAGVALAGSFPQLRQTGRYLAEGWPVALAYVIGFAALALTLGWHPLPIHG
jgi:Na+/H+ antiporter NhaD/arsenite permease-like protein